MTTKRNTDTTEQYVESEATSEAPMAVSEQSAPLATEEPQRDQSAALLGMIERAASNPDVDLDKMERLFDMHDRIQRQAAEREFASAMARAQSQMGRVAADADNPQTRSRYATYAALDRALRPIYTAEGFAISFDTEPSPDPEWLNVTAVLSHTSGHSRTYHQPMPVDGLGAKGGQVMTKTHAIGSGKSYAMRYLLRGIFNVAIGQDDDDGNQAGGSVEKITQDQADTLADLIEKTGTKVEEFKAWAFAGIPNAAQQPLESLRADQYKKAHRILTSRLAGKGGDE